MVSARLPATLWVVRHGQSAGNVARDFAEAEGLSVIDIAWRDIDVPLSDLGVEQSTSLARWFSRLPNDARPEVVLCSPYVRAVQTAEAIAEGAGGTLQLRLDERLREKEFGILDRLTRHGIQQKYPELDEQRQHVGKFYFRPPGGESWCDVILRLRSLVEMIAREYAGQRVLIVAHQVIVNCMRYLVENLTEARILEIDRRGDVPNCGITSYQLELGPDAIEKLVLQHENLVAPLEQEGTPVTTAADIPAAAKP